MRPSVTVKEVVSLYLQGSLIPNESHVTSGKIIVSALCMSVLFREGSM